MSWTVIGLSIAAIPSESEDETRYGSHDKGLEIDTCQNQLAHKQMVRGFLFGLANVQSKQANVYANFAETYSLVMGFKYLYGIMDLSLTTQLLSCMNTCLHGMS